MNKTQQQPQLRTYKQHKENTTNTKTKQKNGLGT